jgi:hypothetical protein
MNIPFDFYSSCFNEGVSDCFLSQLGYFSATYHGKNKFIRWDDNDVCFVPDQQAHRNNIQCSGRHVALLSFLFMSQPLCALSP